MFGVFSDIIDTAIDVAVGAVTFGEYGDISQDKIVKLADAGISIYLMSIAFGVSQELIEEMLDIE